MEIEKLPSGSYRIRQRYDGKRYSLTVKKKPSQKEAMQLIMDYIEQKTGSLTDDSFERCAYRYINSKDTVLSPATIRSYKTIVNLLSDNFKKQSINSIDACEIQTEINRLTKIKSAKTVHNVSGFISPVMKMFKPNMVLNISLPPVVPYEPNTPTDEMVQKVLKAAEDTKYYVPYCLGVYGMRRSEICALTINDLEGNYLTVNKSKVYNGQKFVIKNFPKNETSIRQVYISDHLVEVIKEQGYIYDGYPDMLSESLSALQKKLGLEHFRFHDLRGYYASMAHAEGIPDKFIQANGGWKTDYTLKKHYMRAMKDKMEPMAMKASKHIEDLM